MHVGGNLPDACRMFCWLATDCFLAEWIVCLYVCLSLTHAWSREE